jgi:hypothetical protein
MPINVLNPLYAFDQLPTTSAAAIREFNDRYLAAVGASRPTGWADTNGDLVPTDRPLVTFPVSQLRTFYQKTTGESRFKKLLEKSFDVKTQEFDDGYEAKLMDLFLQVFAYRNWQRAPERLVLAEEQHRHNQVAIILDGTGNRSGAANSANDPGGVGRLCVDGQNFFSATHPANMTDSSVASPITGATTWSNYQSSAKNVLGSGATGNTGTFLIDNLQAEVINMQTQVLDENGYLMGADPDTILVPQDYYEPLKNGLANARVLNFLSDLGGATNAMAGAAVDQIYKGKFNVLPCKEFTTITGSTADWYLVDSKMLKAGIAPWVTLRQTVPQSLALRVFDESSDYFKDTGNIKLSSHIWYGFSLALPHAIRRIKGPTR